MLRVKGVRYYYPISDNGAGFRLLDVLPKGGGPEELQGISYATDGTSVFHLVDDVQPDENGYGQGNGRQVFFVEGADPNSFHTFVPDGMTRFNVDWARDSTHLYYGGKVIVGVAVD